VPDADVEFLWIADMFNRIRAAAAANQPVVMIMPNPWPSYAKVAHLINLAKLSCRHLHTFNMDEYADENGSIAPETWRFGFGYAFKKYFWSSIDAKLRPPEKQVHLLSNKTIKSYSTMLADLGGADICYSGPAGAATWRLSSLTPRVRRQPGRMEEDGRPRLHARAVDDRPELAARQLRRQRRSLDRAPKAATIGPADVIGAKNRLDLNAISLGGTFISWQRLTTRLCLHGPVTPRMPTSILQTLATEVLVADSAAADIEPHWEIAIEPPIPQLVGHQTSRLVGTRRIPGGRGVGPRGPAARHRPARPPRRDRPVRGGTCGEGPFQTDRQRGELVRAMKQLAGGRFFLAVQVSDTSAARVTENIRQAVDAGADAVVLAPPFLIGGFCNRDFLRRYFLEPLATRPSLPASTSAPRRARWRSTGRSGKKSSVIPRCGW